MLLGTDVIHDLLPPRSLIGQWEKLRGEFCKITVLVVVVALVGSIAVVSDSNGVFHLIIIAIFACVNKNLYGVRVVG